MVILNMLLFFSLDTGRKQQKLKLKTVWTKTAHRQPVSSMLSRPDFMSKMVVDCLQSILLNVVDNAILKYSKQAKIKLFGYLTLADPMTNDITSHVCHIFLQHNFIAMLLRSLEVVVKLDGVADAMLRWLLSWCACECGDVGQRITGAVVTSGGIMFALLCLKTYALSQTSSSSSAISASIRAGAGQLLWRILRFLRIPRNSVRFTCFDERYSLNEGEHWSVKRAQYGDLVHQLVLHGGASVVPQLLSGDLSVGNEETVDVALLHQHVQCKLLA